MRKIPVPVWIGLAVTSVLALTLFAFHRSAGQAGDSGDVKAITADIMKHNPTNAPEMPDDLKPSAMAVMPRKGNKR